MKMIFCILLLLLPSQYSNSFFVKGKGFKGYVFDKDHFVMVSIKDQESRYTPTKEDIIKVESLLLDKLKSINIDLDNQGGNFPIIHKKLKKYTRQYVGFINSKCQKVIWINFIWNKRVESSKLSEDIYTILDGGSYYWEIKVNLEKMELFDLNVNGIG